MFTEIEGTRSLKFVDKFEETFCTWLMTGRNSVIYLAVCPELVLNLYLLALTGYNHLVI